MVSFAHVPSHLGCQIYGVCGTIQLPLWTMAEFSPSSITRTNQLDSASVVTQLVIHAQHHAHWLPQTLFPTQSIFADWRPQRGHPWQLEPLGTMQGAGHPNCFLRAIWKCLLFHSLLISVLFIYSCMVFFWNLGRDNKAKNILKFRWLRLSTVDHSRWLCLWFTVNQHMAGLLVCSQPAIWVLKWEFGLTNPISGLEMFLWLCYVLRPLGRSATSSSLGSWLSSVWTSHACGHSFSIVPFECWLLTQH